MKIPYFILSLVGLWISNLSADYYEDIFALILILSIGLIHGANDLQIISVLNRKGVLRMSAAQSLAVYIFSVFAILLIFYQFQNWALFFFLFISAFHFGEQHFSLLFDRKGFIRLLLFAIYGLEVFLLLFFFNAAESLAVISDIVGYVISYQTLELSLLVNTILMGLSFLYFGLYTKELRINILFELLVLAFLSLIFYTATLLWSFAIYFVIWHSVPSIIHQLHTMYNDLSKGSLFKYVKNGSLYWAMALSAFVLLVFVFNIDVVNYKSYLVYFLAGVTFPHVLVMATLFKDS